MFTGANNVKETNTVPIHVIDQDLQSTNDFVVTGNFDRDISGFFTNATRRALVRQAADDWSYFFRGMNLDPVPAGSETTYIWSNNFNGGYYFSNTNNYTGYLLYAYGTTNSEHRSGGEGSYGGGVQKSAGSPLGIKRSGGFEAEIYGNYNTLGWLLITDDNDWLVTGNLGNQTNDFYSIAHHEIGHALIFNPAHPGFNTTIPFSYSLIADGGIPFYDWEITAGALPPGLALDPFTGALTGTPTTNGAFNFTVRVRDYHETGAGLSQSFTMSVAPPPAVQLALSIVGQDADSEAQLLLFGTTGQRQIIQASGDLRNWTPMATNASATNLFQFFETNRWQFPQRFYRAVVAL